LPWSGTPDVSLVAPVPGVDPSADWSAVPTEAIPQLQDLTSEPPSVSDRDPPGFTVRLEGDAVLLCAGELDLATNSALRRSLDRVLRLAPDRVVLDLSRVSFFDAGAIGELMQARTTIRAAGGQLVVRAPSPFGRRVLSIVGLTNLITDDQGQATASSDAPGDVGAHRDELVAAWETECATDRLGATPLVFDPTTVLSEILALLDDPSSGTPAADPAAAPARHDEMSAATGVMQLWALNNVLHARSKTNGTRSEHEERRWLGTEAALAAMASATLAELEQTTLLDPLTGLLNRRALDRDLLKSLAFARRHAQCLSVVMIDVEGLKATNDQFGHAVGDDTLRGVAASLLSALRIEDNAYRIGGDEFVLVLPGLCPDDVDGVMERTVVGAQGAFTWGCAWVNGDEDAASDAERAANLLQQADQRMFDHRARVRGSWERVDVPDVLTRALIEPTVGPAGRFTAGKRSSVVIDEAKGLIAEHFDIGISEGSIMLQAFSTAQCQSVEDAAVALMAREIDAARLAPHRLGRSATPQVGTDQGADDRAPSARS
jgi:anti-anti-sigma factor